MEQRYDSAAPSARLTLQGRRVVRTDVTNDWGLRLQWEIRRDGKVIATPNARLDLNYEHPEAMPGTYEIVLQIWKYIDYRKTPAGEFVNSRFINVSNKVSYTV